MNQMDNGFWSAAAARFMDDVFDTGIGAALTANKDAPNARRAIINDWNGAYCAGGEL